jgi:hypothetical protein
MARRRSRKPTGPTIDPDLNDDLSDMLGRHAPPAPVEPWVEEVDHDMRGRITDVVAARRYITAGRATVTLVSEATGTRFTYRVSTPRDKETGEPVTDGTLMVGLLTGPDNTASYTWLGRIARNILWIGRKNPKPGDISKDAPSAKAIDYVWRHLLRGQMPPKAQIWHEGSCGRCGRKLTVPESVERGIGPDCAGKMGSFR